jgi:hypothetical protein
MSLSRSPVVERLTRAPFWRRLTEPLHAVGLAAEHAFYAQVSRNPIRRSRFRGRIPALGAVQQRALHELRSSGIAVLDALQIGLQSRALSLLLARGERFKAEATRIIEGSADSSSGLAHNEERNRRYVTGGGRSDDYLIKLHREGPTLELEDPLLLVGLDPALLDVVNSYLGLFAKLIYTDMWHTVPASSERRIGSQRWHRDYDDMPMVKAYLYLADVLPEAGAMEYVRGSHAGGRYADLYPWRQSVSRYAPDRAVEGRVPGSDRVVAAGPAGTLVLCDTSGLHRGGPAIAGKRVLATWTFVTPACLLNRRFQVAPGEGWSALSESARYALS